MSRRDILPFMLYGAVRLVLFILRYRMVLLNSVAIIAALYLGGQVAKFRQELNEFRGSVVYDLDKVRYTMVYEMQYLYGQGCRYGTEYPDEFKNVTGFNPNSPNGYCNDEFARRWEGYMYEKVSGVGKK